MMFKVLLIDDEPLIGNVIRTLFNWKKHGFEFVGEAYSGTEALGMMEESQPHIAIIDVNMPEMNGVELQGILRERYPSVKTIMLSSYDDYDYVRECLRNGAVDYLLKHRLDEALLLNVLGKAVKDLQEEDRVEEGRLASKKMAETMKPVLIRSRIAELVRENGEGAGTLEVVSGLEGLYPGAVRYAAAALQIIPFLLLTESFSDSQTNRLVQQAVDVMQQSLGDIHERTAAYVENGRLMVVFAFKERSEHAGSSEAHRWMGKVQHALELMLNLKSVYALGHPCASLTQLGTSYRSAEKTLDTSPVVENGIRSERVTHNEPAAKERPNEQHLRVALTIEEQKQLLLALESLDQERIQQLIASVCGSVCHQPLHSPAVQMIVSELLHTGDKALKKSISTPAAEAVMSELPPRRDLGRIGSMDELEEWLKSYFTALLNLLKRQRAGGSYSRHVSQAIHFILERYQGYINLEMVAASIGLNPSYLSRLFKEETQCNFSEYVNRIRINAAQKLLESDQYSVKQISSQVGFTTYNYFFKVFKELTGMTPHAYVESLRPERQRSKP
ncbi:response regulator transcription factor [Paenibacillus cellulositrophicus]|uniref:response regulator transcription factor n=1 Tax=Paenibacillus cellulositrophicus TaxID=562959 RepID=UPI001FCB59AF|nr:response regulator [Paenibacillus cellulositrophicus]